MTTGLQKLAGVSSLALGGLILHFAVRIVQLAILPPAHNWPRGAYACATMFWQALVRSGSDGVFSVTVGGLGLGLIGVGAYALLSGQSNA